MTQMASQKLIPSPSKIVDVKIKPKFGTPSNMELIWGYLNVYTCILQRFYTFSAINLKNKGMSHSVKNAT